jgi:hypothetical protein
MTMHQTHTAQARAQRRKCELDPTGLQLSGCTLKVFKSNAGLAGHGAVDFSGERRFIRNRNPEYRYCKANLPMIINIIGGSRNPTKTRRPSKSPCPKRHAQIYAKRINPL